MEHTVESAAHAEQEHVKRPVVRVAGEAQSHKKKKLSSKGTRRLTEIDRRVSKAVRRVTRALDHGIDTYIERRDKSAEKRKDGPVVDFVENISSGVSQAVSEASPLLHDIAEAWNTRQLRTQVRRAARTLGSIPFFT